jgi:integrase
MAKRKKRSGLRKRCTCGAKRWNDCVHPWHYRLKLKGRARVKVNLQAHFNVPGPITREVAEELADRYRVEMRAGAVADVRLTLGDVADRFIKTQPDKKHYYLHVLCKTEVGAANGTTVKLGAKALPDITADDLEQVAAAQQAKAKHHARGGQDARRHILKTARQIFNWAIRKRIARSTPFVFEGQPLIDVPKSGQRHRRLMGDEEARLLAAADPFTRDRIIVALETGGRGGELLNIRWADVSDDHITVTTKKTRDGLPKRIDLPISPTLKEVLDRRRLDPDGQPLPPDAYVFGNAVGEPISRRAAHSLWDATRAKANIAKDERGHYTLRFHDLRREFGSQMLEAGASLHEVRDSLGHTNITMTSTYLSTTAETLKEPFKKLHAHRRRKAMKAVG